MILAVAAIALVACSRTFETHEVTPQEIGFGTWAETMTKTVADPTNPRVQGTSYFRQGDGIVVYGSKTITSTSTTSTVFNGVDVVATAEGGDPVAATTWDYNNHRFWDTNADYYTFFAVSPKNNLATTTTTAADGAFVTNLLEFTGRANDILVANKVKVNKGTGASSTYFNSYGTVALNFHHAASLVDIFVKKAPSLTDAAVKVSAFTLGNVYTKGVLTLAAADYSTSITDSDALVVDAPAITLAKWSPSVAGSYSPEDTGVKGDVNSSNAIAVGNEKTIVADSGFTTGNTTANTTPANATTLFDNLIVVPQAFVEPSERANPADASNADAQKITINYTITPEGGDTNTYSSTIWLYDFDSIDNGAQAADFVGSWEPGKHYKFYITIDAHEIKFSADITDWTTINGYHYLIN